MEKSTIIGIVLFFVVVGGGIYHFNGSDGFSVSGNVVFDNNEDEIDEQAVINEVDREIRRGFDIYFQCIENCPTGTFFRDSIKKECSEQCDNTFDLWENQAESKFTKQELSLYENSNEAREFEIELSSLYACLGSCGDSRKCFLSCFD